MSFGVVPTGFSRPPLSDLLADLEAGWVAIFGATVDLSPDGPDAQILGILSGALDEIWQVGLAAYSSYRPRQAVGTALSEIVGFNGITRKAGSPSTVLVRTVSDGAGSVLTTSFRIESEAGDLFRPAVPGFFDDATSFAFLSVEDGPITVSASENWKIVTPVAGLNSMENDAATFLVGTSDESDAELRARQVLSTENGATNILEALYSALLQVEGVTRVRVYVNATNATVDGRPAHSYEVIVIGGADLDVAQAIWENHPAGIELFGATTQNINDSQGFVQAIEFTRPTLVPIIVNVVVSSTTDYPATGDEDMKQAIVDYANGLLVEGEELGIGDDVLLSRLYSATNSIPGHNVTTLQIGDPALGTADIVIDETEIADFLVVNITVTS